MTRKIISSALFCMITIVFSQISVFVPFLNIPFTLSICAVFLSGTILSPKYAFLSQLTYITLGTLGLPVFSGFKSGISAIFGPTGGYILAYPIMVLLMAFISSNLTSMNNFIKHHLSMILGLISCYICACLWYTLYSGASLKQSFYITVLPFIFTDTIKIILCSCLLIILEKNPFYRKMFKLSSDIIKK